MLVYPSSMPVSNRALQVLADALRQRRSAMGSRWRRLPAGEQALLVLAHLNKGETYTALAGGFGVGTTTVFRYVREGVDVLAAVAPTLDQALDVARRKAFVILDGTLLSIDRVGMASGFDRGFYSGKHKRHGLNVQVIADPAGRLVWASPALPGTHHDLGAARAHGLIRLSAGEIRRLLVALALHPSTSLDTILSWSTWRRRRQHQARACHYRRRGDRPPP